MIQWFLQQLAALQKACLPSPSPDLRVRRAKSIQRTPGGMIIVLNGFPSTGKYTILKEVQALLPADKSPRLVDNHLLIDPVTALYPNRGDHHHELRHAIREVYFPYISRLAQEGHVVLITACLAANNDRDAAVFQAYIF